MGFPTFFPRFPMVFPWFSHCFLIVSRLFKTPCRHGHRQDLLMERMLEAPSMKVLDDDGDPILRKSSEYHNGISVYINIYLGHLKIMWETSCPTETKGTCAFYLGKL